MSEDNDIYTYRGRTLEELVPRIREDLGAEAVRVAADGGGQSEQAAAFNDFL